MARKGGKLPVKFEFKGFVNVDFTFEQQLNVAHFLETTPTSLEDDMVVLTEAEFKVGCVYEVASDVYGITLTCKQVASTYFGYCFSFKHADLARGMSIMRWFYDNQLAEEAFDLPNTNSRPEW